MDESSSEESSYSTPERASAPAKMTPEVKGMLSEANRLFFIGQFDQATKLLEVIITKAPTVSEPFLTLANIKQELGEKEKAAQFFFLYAQLRREVSNWVKAAEMYRDLGLWKDASYCYGRALMNSHKPEPEIMKERADCFYNLKKFRKAAQLYQKILESGVDYDPNIAKVYLEVLELIGKQEQGVDVLERVVQRKYNDHLMNLLAELYLRLAKHQQCLDFVSTLSRDGFPVEIEVKIGAALARAGRLQEAEPVFEKLSHISVQHYPDLYLLVGDTYRDLEHYSSALEFYEPLRKLSEYDVPELWLKCAKLYEKIDEDTSAEEAYRMVLDSEATELHTECRVQLSRFYEQIGNRRKALEVLQSGEGLDMQTDVCIDSVLSLAATCRLRIEQASLHQSHADLDNYFETACGALEAAAKCEEAVQSLTDDQRDVRARLSVELTDDSVLSFGLDLQRTLTEAGRYRDVLVVNGKLERLSVFKTDERKQAVKKSTITCGLLIPDYLGVLSALKHLCERSESPDNWALLAVVSRRVDSSSHLRTWLSRYLAKHPGFRPAAMLLAANYYQTGFYTHAIAHYWELYKDTPDDALLNLQLGLSFLYTISSRTTSNKEVPFAKAFYFLRKYKSLRKASHPAEAYYNLARAYQQVSYNHLADHFYRKAAGLFDRMRLHGGEADPELAKYAKKALSNLRELYRKLGDDQNTAELDRQYSTVDAI